MNYDPSKLAGVDGERVYVSRAYNTILARRVYRQLRHDFTPLDGMVTALYENARFKQYSVQDEWWDALMTLALGGPVDYFTRLSTLMKHIRDDDNTFIMYEGRGNYATRFGLPFYPESWENRHVGGYVGEKPSIRDRSFVRFKFRRGVPPGLEQFTPNITEENILWKSMQRSSEDAS